MSGAAEQPAVDQAQEEGPGLACGNCVFGVPTKDPGYRWCHRMPPAVVMAKRPVSVRDRLETLEPDLETPVPQSVWPLVPVGEICGEHHLFPIVVDAMMREHQKQQGGKNGKPHHHKRR